MNTQSMDRTRPPQTPDLPAYKLPPVFETKLDNGMSVLLVADARFPIVTARLGFQAGSKHDPEKLAGLSETAAALLTEGTESRTARQIAEEAAAMGSSLHADSSADALLIAGSTLAENFTQFVDLLADVARHANFPDDEVELRKQNRLQELAAQRSDASFLAEEKFNKVVFGPHPYSHQDPVPESIERLSRHALAGFRDRYLVPNNAVLVLLGALPPRERTLKIIQAQFSDWQGRELPAPPAAEFPEPKRTITLIDRPGSVQADIRIGRIGVTRRDPDYFPLIVGNTILGGGASSRLFTRIREEKGFSYDVHSVAQPLQDAGIFAVVTQVRNEVLKPAIEGLIGEMKRMGAHAVESDELASTKNFLSGGFVIRLETQDGVASQLIAVKLLGLPLDYLENYTTQIRAVTPEQIRAAAKYMDSEGASFVIVGDASQIQKQLETFGPVRLEKAEQ